MHCQIEMSPWSFLLLLGASVTTHRWHRNDGKQFSFEGRTLFSMFSMYINIICTLHIACCVLFQFIRSFLYKAENRSSLFIQICYMIIAPSKSLDFNNITHQPSCFTYLNSSNHLPCPFQSHPTLVVVAVGATLWQVKQNIKIHCQ